MQTELDLLIESAYQSGGATADVNRVYLQIFKTQFWFPVENQLDNYGDAEPFTPLFLLQGDLVFMPIFDCETKFSAWAKEADTEIQRVTMPGRELIHAIGNQVFLALNPGSRFYKEFSPEEVQKLKTILAKIKMV